MSDQSNRAPIPSASVSVKRLPPEQGRSSTTVSTYTSLDLVGEIVRAADERKAGDITVLDVGDISYLADYFIVVTGFSTTQLRAIARSIEDKVDETLQRLPERVEGMGEGGWILLDYGDAIIHIFLPQEREFYNLEAFWGHAEKLDISAFLSRDPEQDAGMRPDMEPNFLKT